MFGKSFFTACCLLAGIAGAGAANAQHAQSEPIVVAQAVNIQIGAQPGRPGMRRGMMRRDRVMIRHDRGLHRGWRNGRGYGARRTTIIKKRGPLGITRKTVIETR